MGPELDEPSQEPEQDRSELSSLLTADSFQAEYPYLSQGSSVYSALFKQSTGLDSKKVSGVSFGSFKKLPSSSSQILGNSKSAARHSKANVKMKNKHKNNERSEKQSLKKKNSGSGSQPPVEKHDGFPRSNEKKALQLATLSQALGFVDRFKRSHACKFDKTNVRLGESENNNPPINLLEASQGRSISSTYEFPESYHNKEGISLEELTESQKNADGVCVAVSLHDGMVLQSTSSLTKVLGYPKDMWVGRSFIDFVHPEDRETFIRQVTENISLPLRNMAETGNTQEMKDLQTKSGSFFCRIRIYNGLKSGFYIKGRKTRYNSFKLSICFSDIKHKASNTQRICIFITAIPIRSAYSEPYEEGPVRLVTGQTGFISQHTAECRFSTFDEFSISYLGYLPQDIIGEDIFKYIHPEDFVIIKEAFEAVMVEQGKQVESKPVRFKIRNGGYIIISSLWSSFINPWSRQLEFVHGKHTIVKGPKFPDIFSEEASEGHSDRVSNELIQNEIKCTLRKTLVTNGMTNALSNYSSKNKNKLSSFMGSLLKEVVKAENQKCVKTAKAIGYMSPSEPSVTPPSYNQLTYNENLTRFFNSQPKTLKGADGVSSANLSGSGEFGEAMPGSAEGNGNNSSTLQVGLSGVQNHQVGYEEMQSQDGTESVSVSRLGSGTRCSDGYKPPQLTEKLLAAHDKDMEKMMASQFKEGKQTGKVNFLKDSVKETNLMIRNKKCDQPSPDQNTQNHHKMNLDIGIAQQSHLSDTQLHNLNNAQTPTMDAGIKPQIYSCQQNPKQVPEELTQNSMTQDICGITIDSASVQAVCRPIQAVCPSDPPQLVRGKQASGAIYALLEMSCSPLECDREVSSTDKEILCSEAGQRSGMQPELLNHLAANDCMIVCKNPPNLAPTVVKVTSVTGEQKSVVEHNDSESATVQLKCDVADSEKAQWVSTKSDPMAFSTSVSSLTSFFKTSDKFQSQPTSDEEEKRKIKKKTKGVQLELSEPFWNQRVKLNAELIYNYQMDTQRLEDILKKDRETLLNIQQPMIVDNQLKDLFTELEDELELEELLVDFEYPTTDEDTETLADEQFGLEEKIFKDQRKKAVLEKMNIFMEADAEALFPMPDTPKLKHKKTKNKRSGFLNYSESTVHTILGGPEKRSNNSHEPFNTEKKEEIETFRFGEISSLGKAIFENSYEDEESNSSSEYKHCMKKSVAIMTEITRETKSDIEI